MSANRLLIYDTTLRDGTQGEGISFSVADKLRIVEKLDHFGVDYIEGGFPGSNPRDITFFNEVKHLKLRHARMAAFGATRRPGIKVTDDPQLATLLASGVPVLTIARGEIVAREGRLLSRAGRGQHLLRARAG